MATGTRTATVTAATTVTEASAPTKTLAAKVVVNCYLDGVTVSVILS